LITLAAIGNAIGHIASRATRALFPEAGSPDAVSASQIESVPGMEESIITIQRLLREVAEHLQSGTKPDRTAAVAKLHRISAIATTLAFTVATKR
jgi:hypothetical protein